MPLVKKHIAARSWLFTDGAKAYKQLVSDGFLHRAVNHSAGEFFRDENIKGKCITVHTNGIDGLWGRYTTWVATRYGVAAARSERYLKEFQWRTNHADEDLFTMVLMAL